MPADRAKGKLAKAAIKSVAKHEASAVTVSTAPLSMPVTLKMDGLTARM